MLSDFGLFKNGDKELYGKVEELHTTEDGESYEAAHGATDVHNGAGEGHTVGQKGGLRLTERYSKCLKVHFPVLPELTGICKRLKQRTGCLVCTLSSLVVNKI